MKKNIFLITENGEKALHDEMLDLDTFIYKISGFFFKVDLQFEFVMFDPNRNLGNYEDLLNNNLYTLVVLQNTASNEIRDAIDLAIRKSEETGAPIRAFFKNTRSNLESIDLVKDYLGNNNIYYDTYESLDEIKMDIIYQIKKLAVPNMKLEFNEDIIKIYGEDGYIKPFNIPFFNNFRDLGNSVKERDRLNIECKKMAQRFLAMFSGSYEKPKEFQEATVKRDSLIDKIADDEDAALQIYVAIKSLSNTEDPILYREVRDVFDRGDIAALETYYDLDSFIKKRKKKN